MNKTLLTLMAIASSLFLGAQSYTVDYFQSNYDSLENYTSLSIEMGLANGNPYYWEKELEFGFDFPFFDETHDMVILDEEAVGMFPGSEDYNLFLFGGVAYTIDVANSPDYLESDIRYEYLTKDGVAAVGVEYRNIYIEEELEEVGKNHYINFQYWFFEDGRIEIHFGDIDLDECSYYFPGQGFSFDNEDPDDEIYGPWITLNTADYSQTACFYGDYSDPIITLDNYENCGVLTSIPPIGSVIRFSLESTSGIETVSEHAFAVTAIEDMVQVNGDLTQFESLSVYDLNGRLLAQTKENQIALSNSAASILLVKIESSTEIETHKVFRMH